MRQYDKHSVYARTTPFQHCTVLANASISFAKQWANCSNSIIRVMRNMDLNYWE